MTKKQNLDFNRLLSSPFKNEMSTSLMSNLFNKFVSNEKSVQVSGVVGRIAPDETALPISDLERRVNAIVPALYKKTGTEEELLSFADIVNRLKVLGVDTANMREWMLERHYNYSLPIDYDKFTNYANYYWVGAQSRLSRPLSWNPLLEPEYYVIARPAFSDLIKMPVRLVATQNLKFYANNRPPETFTIQFTSSSTFTVTSNLGQVTSNTLSISPDEGASTTVQLSSSGLPLCSFILTVGSSSFSAGDFFTLQIKYFTSEIYVALQSLSLSGKGTITGVVTTSPLMSIDGVTIRGRERILAIGQTNPEENGIWVVNVGQKWERAKDATTTEHLSVGSNVWVYSGTEGSGKTYTLTGAGNGSDPFQLSSAQFGRQTWSQTSSTAPNNVNNWQEFNFWVHRDDFELPYMSAYNLDTAVQATRPIIEYSSKVQLNSAFLADGTPTDSPTGMWRQRKTNFNQLPQFDLFRYDGTHEGSTSGIFFYTEDQDYPVDSVLRRRVKTTADSDFIFSVGLSDEAGRDLYYKEDGVLRGLWSPGPASPIVSSLSFTGGTSRGQLTVTAIADSADSQTWTVTAINSTTFSVIGTRSGNVGQATVGQQFTTNEIQFSISAGSQSFITGEHFSFDVQGLHAARFIKQLENGQLVNASQSETGNVTWLTPERMFQNLERGRRAEISFADLANHTRSVIKSQDGFSGVSFGRNNSRNLQLQKGLGGKIRDFGGNFQLLASMLLQSDCSPLSLIDFAEFQYNVALSSIDQFLISELPDYLATQTALPLNTVDSAASEIMALFDTFERRRAADANLTLVFKDTTAPIKNWPTTLPLTGMLPKVYPVIDFDAELGINVIVHHDGHLSPLAVRDFEFDRSLVRTVVERSDGSKSAGVFQETPPPAPYARQLWIKPSTFELKIFDVLGDGPSPTPGAVGDFWYNRQTNELLEWDASISNWVPSTASMSSMWKSLDTAAIRNSLVLLIERRLYAGCHPAQQPTVNLSAVASSQFSEIELSRFATRFGRDPSAPDYDAANAFTWNYKSAVIPGMSQVPARWFNIYKKYFDRPGSSLPTARPNIEPWRLLGMSTKPASWDSQYASQNPARLWKTEMWVFIKSQRPGLKLCVDINTDALLPPYVSAAAAGAVEALLNAIPAGVADVYRFGDYGPTEMLWRKSLEYNYGLARSYFRTSPLQFLDKTWGDTYVAAGNALRVDRNLCHSRAASEFLLHGERLHVVNRYTRNDIVQRIKIHPGGSFTSAGAASVVFEVSHCADNLTVFWVVINGVISGMIAEGTPISSLNVGGVSISGVSIEDLGLPYELGEKIAVNFDATGSPSYVHHPATAKKLKGMCQWFTNFLRYNYISTDSSPAITAYRGWVPRLVHRAGALIKNDTLSIMTPMGSLPPTAYSTVLKKSVKTRDFWLSALRVQLVRSGSSVRTPNGNLIPPSDASDWVFRIESYSSISPLLRHFVLNTSSEFQTFNALNGTTTNRDWKRYINPTSEQQTAMPITITGLQNVINFIYGYIDYLNQQGWVFTDDNPITDQETGRNLDWQLEIEKLIDRVYRGLSPGQGHILNPFMSRTIFDPSIGIVSEYTDSNFNDVYSTQAIYDVNGVRVPLSDLFIIRTDDRCVTRSQTPIFSSHLFIDEYEHCIVFNNNFSDEDSSPTIFDSFLSARIASATMTFSRQDSIDRKPDFAGFFVNGSTVSRNIVSSIDNIASFYDSTNINVDQNASRHAMALLGYKPKDYFSAVSTNPTTQFNFWKGLVQAKGTNMTVDAFVNFRKFNAAEVDEYWAYKIGEYGDAREKSFPEIKIGTADVTQKYARFQFLDPQLTVPELPLYTQIDSADDARWVSLGDLGKGLWFDAGQVSETVKLTVAVTATQPQYITLNNIYYFGDGIVPQIAFSPALGQTPITAVVIGSRTLKITSAPAGAVLTITGYTWINPSKLSPIKLFEYRDKVLIEEIPLWHPAAGIHTPAPLEIINITDSRDPAQYSYTTKTSDNPNYRHLKPWAKREVGRVWWDTRNLGYVPYYDSGIFTNRDARDARWGSLAEWASIDIYEWTQSSVPPSEYDVLASEQEGDSTIDKSIRASGRVALKNYYKRDRIIYTRPVAWSRAGQGNLDAHPAFNYSKFVSVFATATQLIADSGRLADSGVSVDRHFGGWRDGKPFGEVIVGNSISWIIGTAEELSQTQLQGAHEYISSVGLTAIPDSNFGKFIGQLSFNKIVDENQGVVLRVEDAFGNFEEQPLSNWFVSGNSVLTKTIEFQKFGIVITFTRAAALPSSVTSITAQQLAASIVDSEETVIIREAVNFTTLIPLPDSIFVNDDLSPDYFRTDYEWRAWDVPSQDDLDADLFSPFNKWQPFVGDEVTVIAGAELVAEMNSISNSLTLRSGITVSRYRSDWSNWENLQPQRIEKISDGRQRLIFSMMDETAGISGDVIDANRISVYANGSQVNPANYVVGPTSIELSSVLPEGTYVVLLVRAYQPTSAELEFDPEENDDLSIQTQYKLDYEYTRISVRDEYGNIVGDEYYFWVQDKTIPQTGKSMSLLQAKQQLQSGPSTFALFSRLLLNSSVASGAAFDSCAISGLGNLVTKNDSFKLRFLRDFTLRDDPEEIRLKNTHTEWKLIRRTQSSKIPKALWDRLTDAVAGIDSLGNSLPSQVRIDYDARNGTRERFGFTPGQILVETALARDTLTYTIQNTALTVKIGASMYPDYITALDINNSTEWFKTAAAARETMSLIWTTARPAQINEIFFNVLEDALSNNYEFSDIFKTSFITVSSETSINPANQQEQLDDIF